MTEQELRQKVLDIAKSWLGYKESNGTHRAIVDLYNAHKPLAQGYKVTYYDAWCATFVSAVFIKAGLTDIAPTECSCPRMINLYKAKGRWQENDAHKPEPGDVVMYDWQDSGAGDNTGTPDHVGIVVSVSGSTMKIIEGNIDNAVGYRTLAVNGRYIRGYCLPNYASKADKAAGNETSVAKPSGATNNATQNKNPTQANTGVQASKISPAQSFDRMYAKTYTVTASALNMRTGPNTTKTIMKVLKKGEKVTCYGYFTKNGSTVWLCVKDSTGTVGFCSKTYLA